jgi:hypothetical protein
VAWDFFSVRAGHVLAVKPRRAAGLFAGAPGLAFSD